MRGLAVIAALVFVACGARTSLDDGKETNSATVTEDIAAGDYYTCALRDEQVWCWGDNTNDQVAATSEVAYSTPIENVTVPPSVALCTPHDNDGAHSCAVTKTGDVWCWGWNYYGQVGNGATSDAAAPTQVEGIVAATGLACGDDHTCALTTQGLVYCWGEDDSGQLGDAPIDGGAPPAWHSYSPVLVTGMTNVTSIAAGTKVTCALTSGDVWCWGRIPIPLFPWSYTPRPVTTDGHVTAFALGGSMLCTVSGGAVHCVGGGVLGDGQPVTNSSEPVLVSGISNAVSVSVSQGHACAVLSTGEVRCWGANVDGEMGDGTIGYERDMPTPAKLPSATMVSAGNFHTCASTSAGAFCWGDNSRGQLGCSGCTSAPVSTPTAVSFAK